jgi:hypothetical protein
MTWSAILRIQLTGEDVSPVTTGEKRRADRTSSNLSVLAGTRRKRCFSMQNNDFSLTGMVGLLPVSFLWDKARHQL